MKSTRLPVRGGSRMLEDVERLALGRAAPGPTPLALPSPEPVSGLSDPPDLSGPHHPPADAPAETE